MDLRRVALVLAVLGALCLPAPLYLGWAAEATAPPPKSSQVYAAEPVNLSDPSDRKRVLARHAGAITLSLHQVSHRYSAGEYAAPNRTRRTLETALRTGRATTDDPATRADLRRIARNHTFLEDAGDDRDDGYARLEVREDGAVVRAESVTEATVANVTAERAALRYADLSAGERRTFDRILANSTAGYRPRADAPLEDALPALVSKDGTLYSVYVRGHVDDFGPGFGGFLVGVAVAGVGAVLLLVAGGLGLFAWWRDR